MTLFVDASAIVAMLASEPDSDRIFAMMDQGDRIIWSGISHWETAIAIARKLQRPVPAVVPGINDFARRFSIETVPIGEAETQLALDAFGRFGKGTGHPAQLNMGDCFAYASAKANDAQLLYKGNDFAHTDLA